VFLGGAFLEVKGGGVLAFEMVLEHINYIIMRVRERREQVRYKKVGKMNNIS
jgi:hypothetical protein